MRLSVRWLKVFAIVLLLNSSLLAGIAVSADKQLIPIFYLSGDTQIRGFSENVILADAADGTIMWKKYLQFKYPYANTVIYGLSPYYTSALFWDSIQIRNAVDAARELGLTLYFLYPWARFAGRDEVIGQKNDKGEVDDDMPAIQDSLSRGILKDFIERTVREYRPDGVLLDSFRYSNRNFGYSEPFLTAFQRDFPSPFENRWNFHSLVKYTQPVSGAYFKQWIQFREKEVGQLIKEMAGAAREASRPNGIADLPVGMFVGAPQTLHIRETMHAFGQLNPDYLKGTIDFLIPMAYAADANISLYNTLAFKPLGFELWAGLSAEDTRHPQTEEDFEKQILTQFQVVDRVVIYQDLFIGENADDDEIGLLQDISYQMNDNDFQPSEGGSKIMFVYSNSDLMNLEGQDWWTEYYCVVQPCLENGFPVVFGLLQNLVSEERDGTLNHNEYSTLVFIRPYNFSSYEEKLVARLRREGFSFVVINPNDFFLGHSIRKGVCDAQIVELSDHTKNSMLSAISTRYGDRIDITVGKGENYVEYFTGQLRSWNTDAQVTVDSKKFPVIISKNDGERREIYSGLTPKSVANLADSYGEIMRSIFLWSKECKKN